MKTLKILLFTLVALCCVHTMSANGSGRTGSAVEGCNNGGWSCHGGSSGSTTVTVLPQFGATVMAPGETRQFTAVVAHSSQPKAGINVVVRNANNTANAGTMTAGTGTKVSSGEITHNNKQDFVNGQCTFTFSWTAPTTTGTYSLRAAALAADNNGSAWGDNWVLVDPLDISVENPVIQEPSADAKLCRGEVAVIRWSQPMYDGNVRLEISPNGTNWTSIATTPGYPNFYQWNVPQDYATGSTYRLRIIHATRGTIYNTTTYQFGILPSPVITKQPVEVRTCRGNSATFSINVDFPSNYTYQWRHNFTPITGATSTTYTIPAVSDANMGNYDVVITGCRAIQSSFAALILSESPYFVEPPENTDGCLNQPLQLFAKIRGENARIQWRFRGNALPGKTDSILTIPSLTPADTGLYDAIASGNCAPNATSLPARVSFTKPSVIKSHSKDTVVCLDQELVLKVEATGKNLIYRWKFNNALFVENASPTFTILNVGFPSVGTYAVDVVSPCGAVTPSGPFKVNMRIPVSYTKHPRDTSVRENSTVILTIKANGDNPKYQWYKGTAVINGATTNTLVLNSVKKSDAARYSCVVKNECNTVQSNIANVTVTEAPANPILSLNVKTKDFTCIKVDETAQENFTTAITNIGGQKLTITSIKTKGNDETAFIVTPGTLTLQPGQSADLTIKFAPKERRNYATQIVFESNSAEEPGAIDIMGKGCVIDFTSQNVTLPTPITIGNSKDTTITVSNSGDYDIIVVSAAMKGDAADDYTLTSPTLPDTLKPTEQMSFDISFKPSIVGIRSAFAEIVTNESTYKAELMGEGEPLSSIAEEIFNNELRITPNPSNGVFTVQTLNTHMIQHVYITDMLGAVVWDSGKLSGTNSVNINHEQLSSGQYYVVVHKNNTSYSVPIQLY